jgi:S1-C subfamily serine protease
MNTKYKLLTVLLGCMAIIGLSVLTLYASPLSLALDKASKDHDGFLAAVFKAGTKTMNVFERAPEYLLQLRAPSFSFLPLVAPGTSTKISLPKKIAETVTNIASTSVPFPFITNVTPINEVSKNDRPEGSVVNIFCSQKIGGGKTRRIITGSGTIISKDGTVLTNAHVGQFVLIADSDPRVSCLVRTGSPARSTHSASTVFISPTWVRQHAQYINSASTETGEADYALIKIVPTAGNRTPAPVALATNNLEIGSIVKAAAYPADILGSLGTNAALALQTESSNIVDTYSFNGQTAGPNDIIETADTAIGQKGASGGALFNAQNELSGMITIVVNGGSSSKKRIRAITPNHINMSLNAFSGDNLTQIVQSGSQSLKGLFDRAYRSELTNLLNKYISY